MKELKMSKENLQITTSAAILIRDGLKIAQKQVYELARSNGFWEEGAEGTTDGEKIALMHSELSEALEALRKGDPQDEKLTEFKNSEVELADCIIRILDFAAARGLRVAEALIAKHNFNTTRPYKHGKKF